MTEKITSNQENRIMDLTRDMVRGLNLTKDEAQEIIEKGGLLQEQIKPIFQKLVIVDNRFGPAIKEFDVTIPADYNPANCIDVYAKKVKGLKTTYYYNDALTSANFPNPSNTLQPGKTYTVKLIPILETVTSEDCLIHLAKQNARLVGAQGLPVIDTQKLPKGKWYVSFDQKENLWKDSDGYHWVPYVFADGVGDFEFSLGCFGDGWAAGLVLLCFCDKQSLDA